MTGAVTLETLRNVAEGEELFVKYKDRVAGVVFKEGKYLKVRRKYNT